MSKKLLTKFSYSFSQLSDISELFWTKAKEYHTILFSGEMGAGKTTFIHYLCGYLGVPDNVSSPTFSLINEYSLKEDKLIFHLDLYRINNITEAINAGIEDCILQSNKDGNYVFIEWPEKAIDIIPQPYLFVKVETINELERIMELWAVE